MGAKCFIFCNMGWDFFRKPEVLVREVSLLPYFRVAVLAGDVHLFVLDQRMVDDHVRRIEDDRRISKDHPLAAHVEFVVDLSVVWREQIKDARAHFVRRFRQPALLYPPA